MYKKSKKNKAGKLRYDGYSFIEGMFAMAVVTVGMLAVVQLITDNLSIYSNEKSSIEAAFLAQEGLEIARNVRDNNWTQGLNTFDSSDFPNSSANNCRADMFSTTISDCSNNTDKTLHVDPTTSEYSMNANHPASKFRRMIYIDYDTGSGATAAYADVVSVVVWEDGTFPATAAAAINPNDCSLTKKCIAVSSRLTKWGGV